MKKRLFFCFVMLPFLAFSAHAETVEQTAKKIIKSKGLWCEGVVTITPTIFGNTANHTSYHVFCDGGSQVANYLMEVASNGSYVNVSEE